MNNQNIIINSDTESVTNLKNDYTEPRFINLVLSGGSVKGISHIGAIQKLIDAKLLDLSKLKALAGTSIGAFAGCLIVLGFTPSEIWDFILNIDTDKLVKPDFLLFKKCGVETGQIIHNIVEEILTKKTGIKHINFKQLYEKTGIHFTVIGSCLTTKEVIYYDHINNPNFKVSMAVRISIGMPGFFIPIVIDNKTYIDGAVLNNYAMNLFEKELDKTVGVLICNEYNTDYKYPEEYFVAIMNLFMYHYYNETSMRYANNTVYVKRDINNLLIFNFAIDDETKYKLYQCGIIAAEEFIEKINKNSNPN